MSICSVEDSIFTQCMWSLKHMNKDVNSLSLHCYYTVISDIPDISTWSLEKILEECYRTY